MSGKCTCHVNPEPLNPRPPNPTPQTPKQIHTLGHTMSGKCTCHVPWETSPKCLVTGHAEMVLAVAFSPDGTQVVSGSNDKLVKIWNAESGLEVRGGGVSAERVVG